MKNIGTDWTIEQILGFTWQDFSPYYKALSTQVLTDENINEWLEAWSNLLGIQMEMENRLYVAAARNTADIAATETFESFLNNTQVLCESANQQLTERLLNSQVDPQDFSLAMRNLRTKAVLFNKVNLPLLNEQAVLATEYDKITGSQAVEWQGEERTVAEIQPLLLSNDRSEREQAWRRSMERQVADRQPLNTLWSKLIERRHRIAINAGLSNYRDYRWLELYRFAYSPDDCLRFHDAIEKVVVPAVSQLHENRRKQLGIDSLRPWDLDVETLTDEPLAPYQTEEELETIMGRIVENIDPDFGEYYRKMRENNVLDLHNRSNKATGGFTLECPISKEPTVFLNCVGLPMDVLAVLHECGHCFQLYDELKNGHVKYAQQIVPPMEFAEVSAMGLELIGLPYLAREIQTDGNGTKLSGFYDEKTFPIAEIQAWMRVLTFLPFMSVVDLFQHWAYTHTEEAMNAKNCDRVWADLWDRFMPDADWTGLEDIKATGWHRKIHIYSDPFYYIEYGLAYMGAIQVWQNAQQDHAAAIEAYRRATSLGATQGLRDLFKAANIELVFDTEPLQKLVDAIMARIKALSN